MEYDFVTYGVALDLGGGRTDGRRNKKTIVNGDFGVSVSSEVLYALGIAVAAAAFIAFAIVVVRMVRDRVD